MRFLAWPFAVVCWSASLNCTSCESAHATQTDASEHRSTHDPLRLTLTDYGNTLSAPTVRVALRNDSEFETHWVNYRLSAKPETSVFGELWFKIVGANGTALEYRCMDKAGPARDYYYMILRPGAEVSALVPLRCYDFSNGASYKIVAWYKDKNATPPPVPARTGAKWFSKTIMSNAITITAIRRPSPPREP